MRRFPVISLFFDWTSHKLTKDWALLAQGSLCQTPICTQYHPPKCNICCKEGFKGKFDFLYLPIDFRPCGWSTAVLSRLIDIKLMRCNDAMSILWLDFRFLRGNYITNGRKKFVGMTSWWPNFGAQETSSKSQVQGWLGVCLCQPLWPFLCLRPQIAVAGPHSFFSEKKPSYKSTSWRR